MQYKELSGNKNNTNKEEFNMISLKNSTWDTTKRELSGMSAKGKYSMLRKIFRSNQEMGIVKLDLHSKLYYSYILNLSVALISRIEATI